MLLIHLGLSFQTYISISFISSLSPGLHRRNRNIHSVLQQGVFHFAAYFREVFMWRHFCQSLGSVVGFAIRKKFVPMCFIIVWELSVMWFSHLVRCVSSLRNTGWLQKTVPCWSSHTGTPSQTCPSGFRCVKKFTPLLLEWRLSGVDGR